MLLFVYYALLHIATYLIRLTVSFLCLLLSWIGREKLFKFVFKINVFISSSIVIGSFPEIVVWTGIFGLSVYVEHFPGFSGFLSLQWKVTCYSKGVVFKGDLSFFSLLTFNALSLLFTFSCWVIMCYGEILFWFCLLVFRILLVPL